MTDYPFNSHIFDVLELDTDLLTPQLHLVAQAQGASHYRGTVIDPGGLGRGFSLAVVPSPAAPSVNIDISQQWRSEPSFTVVERGYIVVSVLTGRGGQSIRIYNDKGVLLDNKALQKGQQVVMRVLRPGRHQITDATGGGTCTVTVPYPQRGKELPSGPIDLAVTPIAPGSKVTRIDPPEIASSVIQPIVVSVQDATHLVTKLQALTDRHGDRLETKDAIVGNRLLE